MIYFLKTAYFNKYRIEVSIKASRYPLSKHPIARVLEHVHTQIACIGYWNTALMWIFSLAP